MKSIQKVIQEYVDKECSKCKRKDCDGIKVTQDGRAVCEVKYGMSNNK